MDADRKLINQLLDALEKLLIESGAYLEHTCRRRPNRYLTR
jgi:hypothetical protein